MDDSLSPQHVAGGAPRCRLSAAHPPPLLGPQLQSWNLQQLTLQTDAQACISFMIVSWPLCVATLVPVQCCSPATWQMHLQISGLTLLALIKGSNKCSAFAIIVLGRDTHHYLLLLSGRPNQHIVPQAPGN